MQLYSATITIEEHHNNSTSPPERLYTVTIVRHDNSTVHECKIDNVNKVIKAIELASVVAYPLTKQQPH